MGANDVAWCAVVGVVVVLPCALVGGMALAFMVADWLARAADRAAAPSATQPPCPACIAMHAFAIRAEQRAQQAQQRAAWLHRGK